MPNHECLICGISRAEVEAVRKSEGYTLGCGIESNTEAGYEYDELSPRHRWAPWRDKHLAQMDLKPEAFDRYRESHMASIRYAPCDDTKRGHVWVGDPEAAELSGLPIGACWACEQKAGNANDS